MKKDKNKTWIDDDPHSARERRRYDNPIPSREFLLQKLQEAGRPLRFEALADEIGIDKGPTRDALLARLDAMVRDGQLVRDRRGAYGPVAAMDLVAGRVIGHRDGFGFLVPDDGGDDVFLGPRQMKALIHGDRIVVRVRGVDHRGRREGSVVDILERNTRQVVGRYFAESGIGFVVPEHAKIPHDVVIPPAHSLDAKPGQMVVAELIEQPSKNTSPIGRITEVLGDHMAPGMEIDVAIRAHGIPHEWPPLVLDEAEAFGDSVPKHAIEGREDLRDTPLVTIDGGDARDFDDAVYAERTGRGWKLIVAIADVSAYVQPGTALDIEAQNRATSVYFPEQVIPMLPEALSNGLCSLNPHVDRLCMVCEMQVGPDGKVGRARFYEAVMRSAARLTYEDVDAALFRGDPEERKRREDVLGPLETLGDVFRALHGARERRGAIDFDSQETRIIFGPNRKIARIEPTVRTNAHRLIEECMIAANVETAKFLDGHDLPGLYRVHDKPKSERLDNLRLFLNGVGLALTGGASPDTLDYAKLLERAKGRPDALLIQTLVLRSMPQAVYSPKNIGHFGL
ncbi:MAG: ribonuclease R, partial [Gammaproteobacteria bacterium]